MAKESIRLDSIRLKDIAPVFNLIQDMSREGVITPVYQRPTYMAGLGIQLFSVLLFGRFHIQGHGWFRSSIFSIYLDDALIGFLMMRYSVRDNQDELYLFAIDCGFRRRGYGEQALRILLASRSLTKTIIADCLPTAKAMHQLLKKLGFRKINLPRKPEVDNPYIAMIYP